MMNGKMALRTGIRILFLVSGYGNKREWIRSGDIGHETFRFEEGARSSGLKTDLRCEQ